MVAREQAIRMEMVTREQAIRTEMAEALAAQASRDAETQPRRDGGRGLTCKDTRSFLYSQLRREHVNHVCEEGSQQGPPLR